MSIPISFDVPGEDFRSHYKIDSVDLIQAKQLKYETDDDDKANYINDGVHYFSLNGFRDIPQATNPVPSLNYQQEYLRIKTLQLRKHYSRKCEPSAFSARK
jgi:hypothetical protein